MITRLYIAATEDNPEITLDKEANIFEIKGRSLPENVIDLYSPVFVWFKEYFNDPLEETEVSIMLEYYNSSTEKILANLFKLLEANCKSGCNIKIVWYYKKNDFTMQSKGADLLGIFNIPNQVIAWK
jgi:hypothetical protein